MRLVETFLYISHSFFIRKSIPQSIGGEDHELGTDVIKVKGQYVWFGDDEILLFEGKVPQSSGSGQDASNPPNSVEANEAPCLLDSFTFLQL